MEIVSKPDMRSADEAKAYVTKLRAIMRYIGVVRRRHGEGQPARRRQRLGAPPRRAARHALRDQERQLDSLHRPGDRDRSAPPDRGDRGWRRHRAGDAAVRSRRAAKRVRCARRKRRTTIATSPIPTCCRSRSTKPRRRARGGPARTARRRKRRASWRNTGSTPTTRRCSRPIARRRRLLRGGGAFGRATKRDAKVGGELDHGRSLGLRQRQRIGGRRGRRSSPARSRRSSI